MVKVLTHDQEILFNPLYLPCTRIGRDSYFCSLSNFRSLILQFYRLQHRDSTCLGRIEKLFLVDSLSDILESFKAFNHLMISSTPSMASLYGLIKILEAETSWYSRLSSFVFYPGYQR